MCLKKQLLNLKMWLGLTGMLALCVFPEVRQTFKVFPITIATSLLRRYRQIKCIYTTTRGLFSKGLWITRKFIGGQGQIVKDLLKMQIRTWVIKTYKLGDLEATPRCYILTYYKGEKIYKLYFPKTRRMRTITSAKTPQGKDVTKEVLEALGPNHNFHEVPTTPQLLGYPQGLKIEHRHGAIVHVLANDKIRTSIS